jgi:hypothetical protein
VRVFGNVCVGECYQKTTSLRKSYPGRPGIARNDSTGLISVEKHFGPSPSSVLPNILTFKLDLNAGGRSPSVG